ncbi:MAG: glycosyltransferase family 4 protein [Candidatus Hodarchaeales archaeon]|jgi:glycosyltransferase involved in cell wall biosynthesis
MVHFRVGKPDGVSLEMDKWRLIFEKLNGHKVIYLAGDLGTATGYQIPELAIDYEPSLTIFRNAFTQLSDFGSEEALEVEIYHQIMKIKPKIQEFVNEFEINFLVINNLFSLPINIPATVSLYDLIKENNIPTILHHHDFWFEQEFYKPTMSVVERYLDTYFPPNLPQFTHVVINSLAKKNMWRRKRLKSIIVPNVFYFEEYNWKKDEFNKDFLERLKIDKDDLIFLQATRIVPRKGIELVVDLLAELNKPENLELLRNKTLYDGRRFGPTNKIVFVLPNLIEDRTYQKKIEDKLRKNNIEYRFCNEMVDHERILNPSVKKYSLWDTYVYADIVTYPSLWEGWGNQFLEAINAKLPIILFEYPVYVNDIKYSGLNEKKMVYSVEDQLEVFVCDKRAPGFKIIPLGSKISGYDKEGLVFVKNEIIKRASEQTIHCLTDKECRSKVVNENYKIGLTNYSLKALARYLNPLLTESIEPKLTTLN